MTTKELKQKLARIGIVHLTRRELNDLKKAIVEPTEHVIIPSSNDSLLPINE